MKRPNNHGFTIVESMIVLAVSGALFAALAMMVSGQQSRARFNSSVNDLVAQIQTQMNVVSTGSYSSQDNFTCSQSVSGVTIGSGATPSGSNQPCVFLGNAMMFDTSDINQSEYVVHTLVGLRSVSGQTPKDLRESGTRPLTNGISFNHSFSNNLHTTKSLQFNLQPLWMREVDGAVSNDIIGVAFVLSPNQLSTVTNATLDSGSVVNTVVGIPATGLGIALGDPGVEVQSGVDQIARALGTPLGGSSVDTIINPADGIQMCFNQGDNSDRSVLITIGGNRSNTSVESYIYQNGDCT